MYLPSCISRFSLQNKGRYSLKELFKAFDDIKPSEIIECIWAMFDLITTNDWNHLITFASSKSACKERLYVYSYREV